MYRGCKRGHSFKQICNQAIIGYLKNRCIRIWVNGNHYFTIFHALSVLYRAGYTNRNIQVRCDYDTSLSNLNLIRRIACINRGASSSSSRA